MPKIKHEPVWHVYMEDFNEHKIKVFNVFRHYTFYNELAKLIKKWRKDKDTAALEKEVKGWVMYCFWSKCEYEILLSSWIRKDIVKMKIDIYDQLMLNWDSFFKYILEYEKDFKVMK